MPDIQGEVALGKRDPADLSKQEFEETSVKDPSGSGVELSRQEAAERIESSLLILSLPIWL
jgi:hypothetical protein